MSARNQCRCGRDRRAGPITAPTPKGKSEQLERVLATGGAGFIGSHLVDSLLDSGQEVLVVDNFSLGRREHLDRARASGRLTVVDGDIRSKEDLRPVADFAPDTVFHMAALHFIPYCNAHPAEALEVNVLGLDTVIRSVRGACVKTFVFPSSGAIYGFGTGRGQSPRPRPDEVYGISKWIGEQVMARFHDDRPGARTVIARLFNTYGPRETNPHVLPDIS
jgi:UDP-glucose 4-epimerase